MGLQMQAPGDMTGHGFAPTNEDDDHHPDADLTALTVLVKHSFEHIRSCPGVVSIKTQS